MKKIVVIVVTLLTAVAYGQKGPEPFRKGDKVFFAGNSITEAGFYEMYIWQYYMLHFPDRRIQIVNGGVGGDVAGQVLARLDDELGIEKPNVVVVTFGMNDSRYFEYFSKPVADVRAEAVATSLKSYQEMEKKLQAMPSLRKIIMTSSPFDETMGGNKNKFIGKYGTMQEIAKFQKASAAANKWAFVDLMNPMTEINLREQKKDTNFTITGPDRIHPGNAGHLVMAYYFLKAQGLTGTVVADVTLNATSGKAERVVNSDVAAITREAGKFSFDYKPKSLPFPVSDAARVWENPQKESLALSVIPFTKDLNMERLTVKGLKANSNYALRIDGETIGEWKGSAFAEGINLAVLTNTPQYRQAQQVADLNLQYRDLEQKLRAYYWLQYNFFKKKNMYLDDSQAAMDSVENNAGRDWGVASKRDNYREARIKENRDTWRAKMKELADRMYEVNRPVKHRVEIELVK